MRIRTVFALSTVVGLVGVGLVATPAQAATFTAATEAELITAINDANTLPGSDTITLTGGGFALTGDLPEITETLAIVGPGSGVFTILADGFRAFRSVGTSDNTSLLISGITIVSANPAVEADEVDVELTDLVVTSAIIGGSSTGGIDIASLLESNTITLADVEVTGNDGEGAFINVALNARVTVTDSVFNGNGVVQPSDGLFVIARGTAVVLITGVTANSNDSDGIDVDLFDDAVATISNSSASANADDGFDVDAGTTDVVDVDTFATMSDLLAEDNGDNGFESDHHAGSGSFTNVTSRDNGGDGFDIEADAGSQTTVTNAVAIDNAGDGVLLEPDTVDSSITATGGRAEGNGEHGMHMNVDQGTIVSDGFVALENVVSGVFIDGFNGQATLRNATVENNNPARADVGTGGGIRIDARLSSGGPLDVIVEGTTVNDNYASVGGGIGGTVFGGSSLRVVNSTISANEAPVGGGVVIESDASDVSIAHSTVVANSTVDAAEQAVFFAGGTVTIDHSIVADNVGTGPIEDLGEELSDLTITYSLVGTADANALAALTAGTGNIVGESANLGPLVDNGGSTQTHLPLPGSPAIGGGNVSIVGAPATDQRGEDRVGGVIEIGSVELQDPELAATGATTGLAAGAAGLALLFVVGGALLLVLRRRSRESIAR